MAGGGTMGGEAGQVGDDMVGAEVVRIQRGPVLLEAAGEARERLAVGLRRAGRLALDGTAGQVGGDEGGEGRYVGGGGIHGSSMDALLGAAVKSWVKAGRGWEWIERLVWERRLVGRGDLERS